MCYGRSGVGTGGRGIGIWWRRLCLRKRGHNTEGRRVGGGLCGIWDLASGREGDGNVFDVVADAKLRKMSDEVLSVGTYVTVRERRLKLTTPPPLTR